MSIASSEGELVALVEAERARLHVPGVAVGVMVGDEEWFGGFGVANAATGATVSESTRFQVGSITKTMTAAALMREVEAGRLVLDQPVRELLPDFELSVPGAAERVLVRHLVTHVGGWDGDWLLVHPAGGRGDDALAGATDSMVQAPMVTEPGSLFSYNNAGFSIAGRLIEVARGQVFDEVVAESILDPVGLGSAVLFASDAISGSVASGHIVREGEAEVAPLWELSRCDFPVGGIACDIGDLLRWGRFQLGGGSSSTGEAVLSEETMREMHTAQVSVGDGMESMGLAWMLGSVGGARTVSHSGATNGQMALLKVFPEQRAAIGVLTNASTGKTLAEQVARFVEQRVLGLEEPEAGSIDLGDALDEYVGSYEREMQLLEVTREGSRLLVEPTMQTRPAGWEATPPAGPIRIEMVEADAGVNRDAGAARTEIRFVRNETGEIQFLRWGWRLHARR
jgi:CubicO group peptidase (beta-lactamase class C family)